MDKLIQALSGLLTVAQNQPVLSVIILALVVVIIGLIKINGNFKAIASHFPTAKVESTHFRNAVKVYDEVETALETLLNDCRAARVGIHQFSNGTTDLQKNPDMNCNLTFLAMAKGVSIDPTLLPGGNKMPLNIFNDFTKKMWANAVGPVPTTLDINDIRNPTMLAIFEQNGVELVYSVPIVSLNGGPIGMLNVAYLDRTTVRPTDSVILTKMQALSVKIAGYLYAIAPAKRPWWKFWAKK